MKEWSRPADLRGQVQRLWDQGRLLSALLDEAPLFPMRLTLRTPDSDDCTRRFEEVRAWSQMLQASGSGHWRLELREWRHPVLGRNTLPQQLWIEDIQQALRLIGRENDAQRFLALATQARERGLPLLPWLRDKPLKALQLAQAWPRLLRIVEWLQAHPRPGIYLRQVDLPDIDSKFIEQHRTVLAELLDLVLPAPAIDLRATGVPGFARRYGFREKPVRIRLRALDAAYSPLGTGSPEDITVDSESLGRMDPPVSCVFITENETNFLAFPQVPRSLAIFGAGYGLEMLGQLPWLRTKSVYYWGDIDTHGFAILDELRTWLPHARSLLMDLETLNAHESHWSTEASPTLRDLPRLTPDERMAYDALRWQRLAPAPVRLEQERVSFKALQRALLAAAVP